MPWWHPGVEHCVLAALLVAFSILLRVLAGRLGAAKVGGAALGPLALSMLASVVGHLFANQAGSLAAHVGIGAVFDPPSLNLLTINAMTAAHGLLVPLQCEFFALEGLSQLLRTIDLVRGSLNPSLEIQGVVLTMYDKRNNLSEQVAVDVRQHLGEKVYQTIIPRNVRISEAPSHGLPALLYDLKSAGSQAYIKLAGELIQREKSRKAA